MPKYRAGPSYGMNKTALLAAATIVLILSGCMAQQEPPASSGPSGTNGNGSSSTGTSHPPGGTSSAPPGTGPSGGALVRPAEASNTTDGFTLFGTESASGFIVGGGVTFTFSGHNDAAAAEVMNDPCGNGNPAIHIEDATGARLAIRPPRIHCMAPVYLGPFGAGAWRNATLDWNGTIYGGEAGDQPMPAPAGKYYAVGEFTARRGGQAEQVVTRVPINVLEASQRGAL
jgi:hypothetical protein